MYLLAENVDLLVSAAWAQGGVHGVNDVLERSDVIEHSLAKLAAEVAIHALAEAEESGAVPAWAEGAGISVVRAPGDTQSGDDEAADEEFARELLQLTEAWQLRGMHTDWESAVNNNLTCWIELWTEVSRLFRAHGKQLAMSIVRSPIHLLIPRQRVRCSVLVPALPIPAR